jgi:hypothetical protein
MLAVSLLAAASGAPPDPKDIVARSVGLDRQNWDRLRDYTFIQQVERRDLDGSGRVKKVESNTYDVLILDGTPYERKIARNGQPLAAGDARKEEGKFERERRKRLNESDSERRKRLEKESKSREEGRAFLREIPEAYLFRLAGEERIEGRAVWVIDATPRADYRPKIARAALLSKLRGRMWIDQEEYQWVRVEVQVVAPISFGLVLARLNPGTRVSFLQTRINNELWVPTRIDTRLNARLALLKKFSADYAVTYREYRKFSADSRLLPPP